MCIIIREGRLIISKDGYNRAPSFYTHYNEIQERSLQEIKGFVILYLFAENFNGDKII